jgi:hypothetical protein
MTLLQCHTFLFNLFLLACEGNENESPGKSKRKQTISKPMTKRRIDVMMTAKRIGFALVKNQNDTLNSAVNNY